MNILYTHCCRNAGGTVPHFHLMLLYKCSAFHQFPYRFFCVDQNPVLKCGCYGQPVLPLLNCWRRINWCFKILGSKQNLSRSLGRVRWEISRLKNTATSMLVAAWCLCSHSRIFQRSCFEAVVSALEERVSQHVLQKRWNCFITIY